MDAQAKGLDLDHRQIFGGSILQSFGVLRGETDFHTGLEPDDYSVALTIVMGAFGPRTSQPFPAAFRRCLELLGR